MLMIDLDVLAEPPVEAFVCRTPLISVAPIGAVMTGVYVRVTTFAPLSTASTIETIQEVGFLGYPSCPEPHQLR